MMNEAVSKENFERMEKGLPPIKPKIVPKPEPTFPIINNEVKCSDISPNYKVALEYAERKNLRNKEGIMFLGFSVIINLSPIAEKKGPGRPKESDKVQQPESKILKGWMLEGQFLELIRTYRKQIDQQIIHW